MLLVVRLYRMCMLLERRRGFLIVHGKTEPLALVSVGVGFLIVHGKTEPLALVSVGVIHL